MKNLLCLVRAQHQHFGIAYEGPPRELSREEKRFRFVCMSEEIMEYLMADNPLEEYDALLDILVFTLGTLERHGFPLDGIEEVIAANMQKVIGPNARRGGFELDLKKPEGWKAPDLSKYIIGEFTVDDNSGRS